MQSQDHLISYHRYWWPYEQLLPSHTRKTCTYNEVCALIHTVNQTFWKWNPLKNTLELYWFFSQSVMCVCTNFANGLSAGNINLVRCLLKKVLKLWPVRHQLVALVALHLPAHHKMSLCSLAYTQYGHWLLWHSRINSVVPLDSLNDTHVHRGDGVPSQLYGSRGVKWRQL